MYLIIYRNVNYLYINWNSNNLPTIIVKLLIKCILNTFLLKFHESINFSILLQKPFNAKQAPINLIINRVLIKLVQVREISS